MIYVKATDSTDLRIQLESMFPNLLWKDKVKLHERETKGESIWLNQNIDDITIRIPTKYKDRNVFLLYSDV